METKSAMERLLLSHRTQTMLDVPLRPLLSSMRSVLNSLPYSSAKQVCALHIQIYLRSIYEYIEKTILPARGRLVSLATAN